MRVVVVVGNGIVGNLTALYLRKKLPKDVEIVRVGPKERHGMPVVGESIIEITTHFLEDELGMGDYLVKNHLPKYALTYYFKLNPNDPSDRTYSVHCNERGLEDRMPLASWDSPMAQPGSWLLNREVFDKDIKDMVGRDESIEKVYGLVRNIDLKDGGGHQLTVELENGEQQELTADWLVDCAGRKQLLARKMGLVVKPEDQRDCFWFKVRGFDRDILKQVNALGPMPPGPGEDYHYDRYYSTHHFLGKGNWIWMIPMKSENEGEDLISIGFVSHPDHFEGKVRSIDDFMEVVGQSHPVITDLVASGEAFDTNMYRKYHYHSEKVFSKDRWAIMGDAAFAPDPMFSNGLAFSVIQLDQLQYLINLDLEGTHEERTVQAYSDAFLAPVISSQLAISKWYESMDDPYLSSLRLNWIEVTYFYLFLPLVINRCHYDPKRMKLWKVMQLRESSNPFEIPNDLLEARAMFQEATPDHFLYKGKEKTNPRALRKCDDVEDIYAQIIEGKSLLTQYTEDVRNRVRSLMDRPVDEA